jgi:predicted DCC family thiol-disulfide oxidoreductase YuxK
METGSDGGGVWFIYDGECPLCSMAAHALHIRQQLGPLHLIDARQTPDDPLMQEVRRRKLDLDEGMVIWWEGTFYHGRDALRFMARYAGDEGWFNRLNRVLFRSDAIANRSYPKLRAIRNLLLVLRGVGKINECREDASGR